MGQFFAFLPINDNDAGRAAMTSDGIPPITDQEACLYRDVHAAMCTEDEMVVVSEVLRRTSVFTPEYLDAIPALPHTITDKLFVMDLQALQGKRYGGASALYLCAGVLTSMVVDVTEGVHLKRVSILERNPRRKEQAEKVLQQLHAHFPEK